MKKHLLILFLCSWSIFSFGQHLNLIPQPSQYFATGDSDFVLTPYTPLFFVSGRAMANVIEFNSLLKNTYGFNLKWTNEITDPKQNFIYLNLTKDSTIGNPEGYTLESNHEYIKISANTRTGIFYGLVSVLQLMKPCEGNTYRIPSVKIIDEPRFKWRGMHLDVCRHFFGKEFIKRYIDLLALYKINTFHWHLTDDQGWRIEIKKYPRLTEIGGWRNGSMVGRYNDHKFDSIHYGGFYTQDDIREVVKYASSRHITVVPEIEMPGHALAALAAYPELACTEGAFEVSKEWGVFDDVFCAGNENTYTFFEDVLTEVTMLFPGKYIHIGGDECPKTRWKTCPKCQKKITVEGLKDEHELQSYFIKRMEKFLNTKGKQIIGWDEILEGGLAPNAAVMSWRGEEGGIESANQHHYAVMTPGSYCYFDHYQGNPETEPVAFGGLTTIEKVYSYDPVPDKLNDSLKHYILGAQANLWTEYILNEKHVEYMAYPRICALAEVLWTPGVQKDFDNFSNRLLGHLPLLEKWNVNYSNAIFQTYHTTQTSGGKTSITVHTQLASLKKIQYRFIPELNPTSTDSVWNLFEIKNNEDLVYSSDIAGTFQSRIENYHLFCSTHLYATQIKDAKVSYTIMPSQLYNSNADVALINGLRGSELVLKKEWLGWLGEDVVITIDLLKIKPVEKVTIGWLLHKNSWIWLPQDVQVDVSKNGKKYKKMAKEGGLNILANPKEMDLTFKKSDTRYVRITLKNAGLIPDGNPGAGEKSWMFLDEISIE